MAYDAEIRVGTKVDTSQMQKLQLKINDATDEVEHFLNRLDELKNKKAPTDEYKQLEEKLTAAKYRAGQLADEIKKMPKADFETDWNKLVDQEEMAYRQIQLIREELLKPIPERKSGLYEELDAAQKELEMFKNAEQALLNGNSYVDILAKDYEEAQKAVKSVEQEIEKLKQSGEAFTFDIDTDAISQTEQKLARAQAELRILLTQQDELVTKQDKVASEPRKTTEGFKKIASSAKKAFTALSSGAKSAFEKVSSVAKKAFGSVNKGTEKTNRLLMTMRSRMRELTLSLLIFNQITRAFNAMVNGAKEGITEFAKYSKDCNAVLSDFKSSLQTMKFNLGAAFAPIVQTIVPYLTAFINVLNSVISKISQFFAVLTGKSTYYRAIQQQVDFAGSLEDTANAAKEAAGALAGFDKLNVVKQQEDSGSGGSGGGSGAGGEFEEIPIDNNIKELAEKVKAILAQLFAPLKEAWEREGDFVMESWKSALDEIWLLIKDIGRDFLIVWNQEETIAIFENILHIIGDIGLVVANLTHNFRDAWNENQTGLHILENIRDIFAVIVENIRKAADFTVEWSKGIDFIPLLTKIEEWTESMVPVFDSLSGILSDFYTQVLLPLAKWAVEEGLPDLLQVFIDFNEAVDWEGLRTRLSEFWEHLEPFAETIGEGLIAFIGDLSQKIADFTNSETFKKMLEWLEEKMDSTTPEDIAKGIERIIEAIIFFKSVSLGLSALTTIAPAISTIKSLTDIFMTKGVAEGAEELTTAMLGTADATGGLTAGLQAIVTWLGYLAAGAAGVAAGFGIAEVGTDAFYKYLDNLDGNIRMNGVQLDYLKTEYDGFGGKIKEAGDILEGFGMGLQGLPNAMAGPIGHGKAMEQAMEAIANGTIYTDEQLRKMQETWGMTEEDIESLRQDMLLANPELRAMADGFGLFNASAETLKDVSNGMKLLSDGTVSATQAAEEFQDPFWNMSEGAKQFFNELGNGNVALEEYQYSILEGAGYSQEFVNSLDNAFTGMEGFNENAATAGLNAGLSLAKGLQDSKADISTSIAGLSTQIETEGSAMEQQTTVLGGSLIAGFNNGITNNMETTTASLDSWSDAIIKAIHDGPLKFGSPSKKTEEFGKDTVEGYNNGVSRNVTRTIVVIKSYMQTIQSTFMQLVGMMSDVGQKAMSALIETLISKQSELKAIVESIVGLVGSAAAAASKINTSVNSATLGAKQFSLPQLTSSSVVRGGNPYGAMLSMQSRSSSGQGLSVENIEKAMERVMSKNGGGEYTFVAQLNGKVLYSETVRQDQMIKKSAGKSRLGN